MGTITKALNLLNYLSENDPELGLTDFTRLTGQDKATLHRHLCELEANGFLEQNTQTRKYRLGSAILRLSSVRERTFPARRVVAQWVTRLADDIGELVHASTIQANDMSPFCYRDGGYGGTRVYFSEAELLPLHATASGLSALAFGSPSLLARVLTQELRPFTSRTITDPEALEAEVEKIRSNGFSRSQESYEREVSSVAAPFFLDDVHAYGTIAIAIPASRMDDEKCHALVARLWDTCIKVSHELGTEIPQHLQKQWLTPA